MSLRFITGRAGSGKTNLCLKEINYMQEKGVTDTLIYIVPEQFSLQAERDLIAYGKSGTIMQAQVLSFNRLAYTVFGETGLSKKDALTDIGRDMLVKKTVNQTAEKLLYFKKAADKISFSQQTSRAITEFFKYGITEETLLSNAKKQKEDSVLAQKLNDMATIYSKYKENIENTFNSSDETLDVLYTKIDNSKIIKNAEIWIDGFYGFTPQESKIIEKLLLLAKNVSITLTLSENALKNSRLSMSSIFYEPKETYLQLCQTAAEINVPVSTEILREEKRFLSPSLAYLEKNYGNFSPVPFKEVPDIEIHYADNSRKEAEYTACKIAELVRLYGIRYKDIAVLTGEISSSDSLIRSVFGECKIPYFIDNKRDMTSHPLIRLILSLMDTVLYSLTGTSVFSFLKTGLTPLENSEIEKLENYVLRYGIKGWKWTTEKWLYGVREPKDIEKSDEINAIRNRFFEILAPFADKVDKNKTYASSYISEAILNFIDQNDILPSLDSLAEENTSAEDIFENKRCWNIVCSIMDTMHTINGNEPITLAQYRSLFESAAQSAKIGIIPPGTDNVTVGDIDRTRLHEIKVLFIMGANEGKLPAPVAEGGIFAEAEREYLEEGGMHIAPSGRRKTFEEQFIIYSSITKPSQKLFVSCSTGTYDGKTLSPSPVISKIKNMFPLVKETTSENNDFIFSSPFATFHYLGENMEEIHSDVLWSQAYEYFKTNENWQRKTHMVENALQTKPLTEKLSEETSQMLFPSKLYSSISRLERFASCPYYYFADFTLKAKERPLYSLASPDLGTIFHGVLKDFFETAAKNGLDVKKLSKPYIQAETEKCISRQIKLLGNDIFESQFSMQYLLKRIKRISARSIQTLCSQSSEKFVPAAFEIPFGSNGPLPPVVIEGSNGKQIILNGQIDRLDVYENENNVYVKITDYKSGQKAFSLQDVFYGLQLQLLIYIDSVLQSPMYKGKNILPAGVFYFRIKDPIIATPQTLTEEKLERLIKKELKLSGLVLGESEVIEAIDPFFSISGGSDVIPVSVNKDGTFSKFSSVADSKRFQNIINHSLKTAKTIGEQIQEGYIKPFPYKSGGKKPCSYCPYSALCGFDPTEHKYRYLRNLTKEEVFEKTEKE